MQKKYTLLFFVNIAAEAMLMDFTYAFKLTEAVAPANSSRYEGCVITCHQEILHLN